MTNSRGLSQKSMRALSGATPMALDLGLSLVRFCSLMVRSHRHMPCIGYQGDPQKIDASQSVTPVSRSHQPGDAAGDAVDEGPGGGGVEAAGVGGDFAGGSDGDAGGDGRVEAEEGVGADLA